MLNMHILDQALVCVYLTATHSCLCFKSIGIKFHHKLQPIRSTNVILSGRGRAARPRPEGGLCRQGAGRPVARPGVPARCTSAAQLGTIVLNRQPAAYLINT